MADKFDILTNISDGALLRRSGSTLVSLTPEQLAALDALTAAFQAKNASLDSLAADTVPAGLEAVLDGRYGALDEDDFASNSATLPPSQQSVAEYTAATFTPLTTAVKPRVNYGLPVPNSPFIDNYSVTLNRLVAYPLAVPYPVSIDQLGVYCAALEASSTVRLGLYLPAADGTPGALLAETSALDTSTTGNKIETLGAAVNITGGLVYFAYVIQGAASTVRLRSVAAASGHDTGLLAVPSSTATVVFNGESVALRQESVSGALPDPMVPVGGGGSGMAVARPWLRVSALL